MNNIVTRFAPSPTGLLHLGHAYSAIFAYNLAQKEAGQFILRIEDIDHIRCKPEYIEAIYKDLEWLGLTWPTPVRIQSRHYTDYKAALNALQAMGVVYPCFCSRREIRAEVAAAGRAPHCPEGPIYPGTCRTLSKAEQKHHIAAGKEYALRLNLEAALSLIDPQNLFWLEGKEGQKTIAQPQSLGDIVLARKDIGTSYHLSVVVDDALQNITHVSRGEELQYATNVHRVLQELLGYNAPTYHHHPLVKNEHGEKFSKRDNALTLKYLRESLKLSKADIYKKIQIHPI